MNVRLVNAVWGGTLALALAGAVLLSTAAAEAGITDKPLPRLNGTTKARHIYSVVGVQDRTNEYATIFSCTSTERPGGKTITVAVEAFSFLGVAVNDVTAGDGVVNVPPGQTRTIGTQDIASFGTAEDLDMSGIDGGSARILSTSAKILCNAAVVETEGSPPSTMMSLPTYRKIKQQGD